MKLTCKEKVCFFQACPTASLAYIRPFGFCFSCPSCPAQSAAVCSESPKNTISRLRRLLEVSIVGFAGLRSKVVAMALLHSGIRVCCTPPAIGRRRPQFDGTALPCCSRNSPIRSFSGLNLSFSFQSLSVASAIGSGEQVSA